MTDRYRAFTFSTGHMVCLEDCADEVVRLLTPAEALRLGTHLITAARHAAEIYDREIARIAAERAVAERRSGDAAREREADIYVTADAYHTPRPCACSAERVGLSDGSSVYGWECAKCGHQWPCHATVRGMREFRCVAPRATEPGA